MAQQSTVITRDPSSLGSTAPAAATSPATRPSPVNPLPDNIRESSYEIAIALKKDGWNSREIAEHLQVRADTVRAWFVKARRERKLETRSIDERLQDSEHLALDVIEDAMLEGNENVAVNYMKGRGKFRNYSNNNTEGGSGFHGLAIVYTTKDGSPIPAHTDPLTLPGQIVGRPRDDSTPDEQS